MLSTILNAFQVADIRKKIAFTAGILLIYRLGSRMPVPGVNLTAVNNIQKQFGGSNILGLLNLFSGGGLSRIAIFALGIMPYITASIIMQLLGVAVPSLEKLRNEGEANGEIARVLRDPGLAHLALLGQLLQGRDDDLQQLQDDRSRDVGHDPEREDGDPAQAAAREQVEQPEDVAATEVRLNRINGGRTDARRWDVRAQTVERQDRRGEQDLVADLANPERP